MVNPERLHNALAALDILARADGAGFAKGQNVSGELAQDAAVGQKPYISKVGAKWELLGTDGKVVAAGNSMEELQGRFQVELKKYNTRGDAEPSPALLQARKAKYDEAMKSAARARTLGDGETAAKRREQYAREVLAGKHDQDADALNLKQKFARGDAGEILGAVVVKGGKHYYRKPNDVVLVGPFDTATDAAQAARKAGVRMDNARGDAGPVMRKWKVRYASGAIVTVNAPDINEAKARAKQISPRLEPESVSIMDSTRGDAALSGERYAVKRNRRTGDHDLIVDGKVHSEHATTTQALSQAVALGLTKPFGSVVRGDAKAPRFADAEPKVGEELMSVYGKGKIVKVNRESVVFKLNETGSEHKMSMKQFEIMNGRSDADRPQDLSDEALRLRISTLEADLRDAGRTARGPNMTNLNRQLDALVAELRKRRSRSDADETARKKVFHFTYKDPSGDNRTYSCEAYTQELAEQNLRRYRWVSGPITSVRTGGKE